MRRMHDLMYSHASAPGRLPLPIPHRYPSRPFILSTLEHRPLRQELRVNGAAVTYEVDTGCGYTIMSTGEFQNLGKQDRLPKLKQCRINLRTYSGHPVPVIGAAYVKVEYRDRTKSLPVVVVEGVGPSVVGRGWIKALGVDWQKVHTVIAQEMSVQDIVMKHETVFKEELGKLQGFKAKIHVDKDAKPRFYKPRSVPFAMKQKSGGRNRPVAEGENNRTCDIFRMGSPSGPGVETRCNSQALRGLQVDCK